MDKRFRPIFTPIIEYDKPDGTIFKGPQGILTINVELKRSSLWDLRGRWKQTFQKKAVFTTKKVSGNFFLVLSKVTTSGKKL